VNPSARSNSSRPTPDSGRYWGTCGILIRVVSGGVAAAEQAAVPAKPPCRKAECVQESRLVDPSCRVSIGQSSNRRQLSR